MEKKLVEFCNFWGGFTQKMGYGDFPKVGLQGRSKRGGQGGHGPPNIGPNYGQKMKI